jgi:hypothetical protein
MQAKAQGQLGMVWQESKMPLLPDGDAARPEEILARHGDVSQPELNINAGEWPAA